MLPNKELGNQLLDFYGSLLTNHQLEILKDYYEEDFSMVEIAENYQISKAAVSDIINRSMSQLTNYEKNLNLIKNSKRIDKLIQELKKEENINVSKYIKELEKIK